MLHPQARALLDLMIQKGVPPTHTLSPAEARRFYLERRFFTQPDAPALAEVRELQAEGPAGPIPLRLYRPHLGNGTAQPALVYLHGGGWVIGDLDTHDTLCRQLALRSGCCVIAVHYRLAPEHAFPAGVDDAITATRWVLAQAAALGLDPARIAIGGDSAGGNLSATTTLALRPEDGSAHPLRFQLLIYPATDMRAVAASHDSLGQGYLLTRDSIHYYRGHYIPDRANDADWRASPLLAESLAGLPPALVLTAGYDPLRDEGLAYAQRLSESGVACSQLCFERQIHGFITMGRVLEEADTAVTLCAAALRQALA
jgi:acetyl esterase